MNIYLFKSILIPEQFILFNLLIKQLGHPKKPWHEYSVKTLQHLNKFNYFYLMYVNVYLYVCIYSKAYLVNQFVM